MRGLGHLLYVIETEDALVQRLAPEDRLKGLTPEDRLKGLTPEECERLLQHLLQQKKLS